LKKNTLHLENLIEGYILACRAEGKSPNTVQWCGDFLRLFLHLLQKFHCPLIITEINKEHIRLVIRYLQSEARTRRNGQPLSPSTIQGFVRTLKAFFSWLEREDYVNINPMSKIKIPKAPTKVLETFSSDHISHLLDVFRRSDKTGYRNTAIVLLLLDTGLRISELTGLEVGDINLAEGDIRVRVTKGSKERIVPIGSVIQRVLWRYLQQHRPEPALPSIKKVFLNDDGLPLTGNGVAQMLRRNCSRAGISGVRCSPHTLRHTFSKNYLLNGGDIFSLQKILGHSSLASVRIYLNLFAGDVKQQHQRFSPADTMCQKNGLYSLLRHSRQSSPSSNK
jgi:integrase/recombinase XerD